MGVKKKGSRRIDINTTISPYLYEKMETLVENERFSSVSDLVSIAVTEFLFKLPDSEEVKA